MTDSEGVAFLQWCLPKLRLRWPGYRKVRRQVYKRLDRRIKELGLSGVRDYRAYLETHPDEWGILDAYCWISISRFYRDKRVFQFLEQEVLPQLAHVATARGDSEIRAWSVGCAAGEEPYTLAMLWRWELASQFPGLGLPILATDVDPQALARAQRAWYPASSLKDLPQAWLARAFDPSNGGFCLKSEYREPVTFLLQDIREHVPENQVHLLLCRNAAFTYFDKDLQRETIGRIVERLGPGGALVIGSTESLPDGQHVIESWAQRLGVYRRSSPASAMAVRMKHRSE